MLLGSGADHLPNDVAMLQALVTDLRGQLVEQGRQLAEREQLIETLKAQLAVLRRRQFGRRSEKLGQAADQLELQIEELEQRQAETAPLAELEDVGPVATARSHGTRPVRKPLPAHLPRDSEELTPPYAACPGCGEALRRLGEDVSEVLEFVPARLRVRRYVRPVMACRCCGDISQAPPPPLPIPKGNAGPSLLAEIAIAKYDDHLPAYRQAERFAREGLDLARSTLTDWLGRTAALLTPLADLIAAHVLAAAKVHADDTPVPVLAPGAGKTRTGRLWVYARDDRASGDTAAPAVVYRYSPDRKGEHPRHHLAGFRGFLQADAYAGFAELYQSQGAAPPSVVEVACWAHVRRRFYDIDQTLKGSAAKLVLERIGRLYAIEQRLRGHPAEQRAAVRRTEAAPELVALRAELEQLLAQVSAKSTLAEAARYALTRWPALTRYLDDGRLEIDNNIAERAMRAVAIGRKNWLFAGSDAGGATAAAFYTLIETAKLNGHNPRLWLTRALDAIARQRDPTQWANLLPWIMPTEPG